MRSHRGACSLEFMNAATKLCRDINLWHQCALNTRTVVGRASAADKQQQPQLKSARTVGRQHQMQMVTHRTVANTAKAQPSNNRPNQFHST